MNRPADRPAATAPAALFDIHWYLKNYPEAGKAEDAEEHFRTVGSARGCKPNRIFSESFYRRHYPDVDHAISSGKYASGFDHYVAIGQYEGRLPGPLFVDEAWYRARYPEVEAAIAAGRFGDGLDHYLRYGAAHRFWPHAAFAEGWYLKNYPEVANAVSAGRHLCAYQQFMEEGLGAGYEPHPLYSDEHYISLHSDLDSEVRAGRLPEPYLHLVTRGLAEGREWRQESPADKLHQAASDLAMSRLEQFFAAGRSLVLPTSKQPDVSILLVLYNRAELTLKCLESLLLIEEVTFEVVLVDNDSRDRTRDLLQRVQGARVILNDTNDGFVRACNRAAGSARGRHLLFLNNDVELWPSSLRSAMECLEGTPQAGAVGGRVIGLDGRLQEAGSIVWSNGTTVGYGRGDDPESGAYLFRREVDYCSGAFLLTPRELFLRLGGFDEAFAPAYYEEADYCFRLRREGFKVIYDPESVLVHHECASLAHPAEVSSYLARNRPVFVERHRAALAEALDRDMENLFPSSDRRHHRGRILLLDDQVPLERLGGGSPRSQETLHVLCDLGFMVTLYATDPHPVDWCEVRREMPEDTLELINHLGRSEFETFWDERRGSYDVLIASRPHNLSWLLETGIDPSSEGVRLIYDAEAVVARREQRRLELMGDDAPAGSVLSLEEEIELAAVADEIWAVSEEEARLLASPRQRWSVVGHGTAAEPGKRPFEGRRGTLFVGRLVEEWNPNVDALSWYLAEVHPRVIEELGEAAALTVVGQRGKFEFPDADYVRYLGNVKDLDQVFDAHRLFIAPTRFAAGIPHKVTNAAMHGLPVVASSLLADQLGWNDGADIAAGGDNDPQRFAERVIQVYSRQDLWETMRANALERVQREHGPEALRDSIRASLEDTPRLKTKQAWENPTGTSSSLALELGRRDAEAFDRQLRDQEEQERLALLGGKDTELPQAADTNGRSYELARAEARVLELSHYLRAVESSASWRAIQWLRGLVGRAW